MSNRNAFLLMPALMTTSLVVAQDKLITFWQTEPQHQRVTYQMRDDANVRTFFADGRVGEDPASFTGELETLATAQRDDGSRIMQIALKINEDSAGNDSTEGGTLSIMLDKNGNFLQLSGIGDEGEEENTMGAFTGGYICPAFVLFPTMIIPVKPVRVGEGWELHAANQANRDDGDSEIEILRGTGRLRSLPGSKVLIEIDFTSELTSISAYSEPELKEKCIGSLTLTYDLQTSLVVKSYSHTATETIGWAFSDNDYAVKTIIEHDVTLALIQGRRGS